MTDALEVVDLVTVVGRGRRAALVANGVSLRVGSGETVGLVGESGSGKTMMALAVLRLLPPAARIRSGEILVDGTDVTLLGESELRRIRGARVAMVFQDPMSSLTPTMSIGRQVAEAVRVHSTLDRAGVEARVEALLGLVGMPRPRERMRDYPHQLSGGQRQRVSIAIALACNPTLLIADEPTTALDATIQDQILRLLDDIQAQLGMAVLLITHDLGVIAGRADRVAVMYAGRIVEEGTTDEIFYEPRHPYTRALLSSIPRVDEAGETLSAIPGTPPDPGALPPGCAFAPRCTLASDVCGAEVPVLAGATAGSAHRAACHHPLPPGAGAPAAAGAPSGARA
ncbi:MAG TPA: ABC transporter ATP-binding protein [Candidatus Dormibacteraeota bacterium]|nr:ABC transporter ATP-binding protein [Candidatus Dormibacteraeota bacterium]